jgi:hypothetical protein
MVLTLYSAHLVVIATGFLQDDPVLLYLAMVLGAIVFALLWHRLFGQGPLERIVAVTSGWVRRSTTQFAASRGLPAPESGSRATGDPDSGSARPRLAGLGPDTADDGTQAAPALARGAAGFLVP